MFLKSFPGLYSEDSLSLHIAHLNLVKQSLQEVCKNLRSWHKYILYSETLGLHNLIGTAITEFPKIGKFQEF
jgi:hypothetical protein